MFCDAAIGFSSRGVYASVTAAIVAHTDRLFRIIDLMSESTEGASASNAEEVGVNPPHPDDLRNVILGRPRLPIEPVSDGEFSAEAKVEDEPAWVDATSEAPGSDEPTWREVADDEPEPRSDREYQHPPFYTEFEAETDRGHPDAVANLGPPAGFGRRVVAYLIDQVVMLAILSLIFPLLIGVPLIHLDEIERHETSEAMGESGDTNVPTVQQPDGDAIQTDRDETALTELLPWYGTLSGTILFVMLPIFYNAALIGLWGTTIGKRTVNVYVVDKSGNVPGLPIAFIRAVATILSSNLLYVSHIFILRSDHRALHDLLVGSYAITLTSADRPRMVRRRRID